MLTLGFEAEIIEWRGPAPFFFAPLPPPDAEAVRAIAKMVSYGWGVIPVEATIGGHSFTTSLFPRNETYLLPIKTVVRRRIAVTVGDRVEVAMVVGPGT